MTRICFCNDFMLQKTLLLHFKKLLGKLIKMAFVFKQYKFNKAERKKYKPKLISKFLASAL